jgi:hypothetical protein
MEKREGDQLVGAILRVGSTHHKIARWDYQRRMFLTRNVITKAEGELSARMLEDAISDGIITVKERRN